VATAPSTLALTFTLTLSTVKKTQQILWIVVFWFVTPCSISDGYQVLEESIDSTLTSTLKMEAIRFSETLVTTTILHDVTNQKTNHIFTRMKI
jgi:hypothetical protein